jgi:cyclohexanone monooxygenase
LNFLTIPGTRVDTDVPLYEYSLKEIWCEDLDRALSGRDELGVYFKFVDKKLDLSKDCRFNTCVTAAEFDMDKDQWNITTEDGQTTRAKYFRLCTGFAAKHYVPSFKAWRLSKGMSSHRCLASKGIELRDKEIGVISTGASDVQLIQEVGPIVKHLVSFLRQ